MSWLLVGTGIRRYTRAHLRHDRDAARAECKRLTGRLERSAQANRELAAKKDAAEATVRDLSQQLDVANGFITSLQTDNRDLKAQTPDSETTQSIPVVDLPQQRRAS